MDGAKTRIGGGNRTGGAGKWIASSGIWRSSNEITKCVASGVTSSRITNGRIRT